MKLPEGPALAAWWRAAADTIPEAMYYRKAAADQVLFVRDRLPAVWANSSEEYDAHSDGCATRVVGTHRSKSIELPVYGLEISRLGLRVVLRDNFYDWNLVVDSDRPVVIDPTRLFPPNDLGSCFYQGFPAAWVEATPYAQSQTRFACYLENAYALHTFFHLVARALERGVPT